MRVLKDDFIAYIHKAQVVFESQKDLVDAVIEELKILTEKVGRLEEKVNENRQTKGR